MWKILFLSSFFLMLNISLKCETTQDICKEKDKSLLLLELAKDFMVKAKYHIADCGNEEHKSHQNQSLRGKKEKLAAYLDTALELVKEAENNYPSRYSENVAQPKEEKSDNMMLPQDCVEVQQRGHHQSGIYTIRLSNKTANINRTVKVFCDMNTDGGGWTVIQRRGLYSSQEDFNRGWNDYKHGFGDLSKEFWIGNDIIHDLSNTDSNVVRFDMRNTGEDRAYAFYDYFKVENETNGYRLHIGNYTGNAGESLRKGSSASRFATKDRLNDSPPDCPTLRKGGWWFKHCGDCNPNGIYRNGVKEVNSIFWWTFTDLWSLAFFEIKIRNHYV